MAVISLNKDGQVARARDSRDSDSLHPASNGRSTEHHLLAIAVHDLFAVDLEVAGCHLCSFQVEWKSGWLMIGGFNFPCIWSPAILEDSCWQRDANLVTTQDAIGRERDLFAGTDDEAQWARGTGHSTIDSG